MKRASITKNVFRNRIDRLVQKLSDREQMTLTQKDFESLRKKRMKQIDVINQPPHYKQHPSGIEQIQITEHMNFCLGNAIKYIWRADHKGNSQEDLQKAKWYLEREIERRSK